MGAIGDYIHLTVMGYHHQYKYKDGRDRGTYEPDAQAIYEHRKNEIEKQLQRYHQKNDDLLEYENFLNGVLTGGNVEGQTTSAQEWLQDINQQTFAEMAQAWPEMGEYLINKETLRVKKANSINTSSQFSSRISTADRVNKNETTENVMFLSTIDKRLTEINAALNNVKNSTTKQYLKSIRDQVIAALNDIDRIWKGTNKEDIHSTNFKFSDSTQSLIKQEEQRFAVKLQDLKNTKINITKGKKTESLDLIETINFLRAQLSAVPPSVIGDTAEYFIKYATELGWKKGGDELKKFLSEKVVRSADNGGTPGYSKKNFSINIDHLWTDVLDEKGFHGQNDFITYTTLNTKDKVDLIIEDRGWNASIKNYAGTQYTKNNATVWRNLAVVTGTPLLAILQNESANFVNHYFNIITPKIYTYNVDEEPSYFERETKKWNELISQIIILKGLTGEGILKKYDKGVGAMNSANIFIVNDSTKKGGIRVFSMEDVLDKVLRDEKYYIIDNFPFVPKGYKVGDFSVPNARITNLLLQAHQFKVNAHISMQALDEIVKSRTK